jgi:hypothetical protein
MYGQDLKSIALKQKYTGDVTILPRIGGPQAVLRMAQNPDAPTMRTYIHEGRAAALSKMSHVQHLLKIEQMLEQATRLCSALATSVGSPASPAPAQAWQMPRNHSRSQLLRMREEHRRSVDRRRTPRAQQGLTPGGGGGEGETVSEAALERLIALAEAGQLAAPNDTSVAASEAYPALLKLARDQAARLRQAEARADEEGRRADRLAEVLMQVGAAAHEAVGGGGGGHPRTPPSGQLLMPPAAAGSSPTGIVTGSPAGAHPPQAADKPFPPLFLPGLRTAGSSPVSGAGEATLAPAHPTAQPVHRVARPASSPPLPLISAPELKPAWAWGGDLPSPIAEAGRPSLEDTSLNTSMDTSETDTPKTSGVLTAGTPRSSGASASARGSSA